MLYEVVLTFEIGLQIVNFQLVVVVQSTVVKRSARPQYEQI